MGKILFAETKKVPSTWGTRGNVAHIMNYKNPNERLERFRKFVDDNPDFFKWFKKPYQWNGKGYEYMLVPVIFYWENRDLLDSGSRSVPEFDLEEVERIRIAYGL
ncbi:hypothetical protein [Abiotrophia defectiva]|uniref:hypothetical protein n=1 Tax=Abiotrophia defectiva TaxID=46125 RepID=UPI0028D31426|nr:hypothetical protein [Abiotrophia defectiva]